MSLYFLCTPKQSHLIEHLPFFPVDSLRNGQFTTVNTMRITTVMKKKWGKSQSSLFVGIMLILNEDSFFFVFFGLNPEVPGGLSQRSISVGSLLASLYRTTNLPLAQNLQSIFLQSVLFGISLGKFTCELQFHSPNFANYNAIGPIARLAIAPPPPGI